MADAQLTSALPRPPVAVGVVGLGWWGRRLLTAMDGCPELDPLGAVVRSSEGAAWSRERGLEVHTELSALLEDPRIEAVVIATPNTFHREMSVQVAEAGRHVFCEKPLGLTRADAVAIVEACRAADVVLAVGHEIRFEPPVRQVLTLARAGHLGQLVQFDAILSHDLFTALPEDHWRLSLAEAPGGPLTATGIHMVDLSVAFLGRPVSATAHLHRPRATGTLSVLAAYASEARALIGASAVTPFHMRFAVYGTSGWAEAAARPSPHGPGNAWTLTTSIDGDGWTTTDYLEEHGIRDNLVAFATAVRGHAPYPISATEMIDTIALMEAIVRSAENGGATEAIQIHSSLDSAS